MKSRVVRTLLFLLVVLAFTGAAYNIFVVEQRGEAARAAARAFDDEARLAERTVAELKAAQFACVATGQGDAFWIDRATALAGGLSSRIKRLQQAAVSPEAAAEMRAAADGLATARQIEDSIRGYVRNEQRLLASDLIFGDLRQANEQVAGRIAAALALERAAADRELDVVRRTRLATAAGAGIFALLVLLLLLPRVAAPQAQAPAEVAVADKSHATLSIRDAAAPAAHDQNAGQPAAGWSIDLGQAARLCTDFARLRESSELPALLERAARLMNAGGIIVWIDDPAGKDLRPAVAHGYSTQALARIRGISRDADNATACAYRERALQVVAGVAGASGAIAVPLVTPDGCAGVMAAELPAGGERRADVQAVAAILAAQLATLVAPQANAEASPS